MPIPMSADAVLNRYFLEMRAKVLEVGAALDRIELAEPSDAAAPDERLKQLREAIRILLDERPDRAARIQMVFSDPYDAGWRRPARSV